MQTQFLPAISDGLEPLNNAELFSTYGGNLGSLLLDAAAFLISPAVGLFYLGAKAGWNEAANN